MTQVIGLGEDVDLEPAPDAIVQAEEDTEEESRFVVPVHVEAIDGPVQVQSLPSKTSRIRTLRVLSGQTAQLLNPDPRRRMTMISASGSFYIANKQSEAADDLTRFLLPVGAALPPVYLYTTGELWAGAGSEVLIYIYTEQWAN